MMTADLYDVNVQVVQNTLDLLGEFDPEMTDENVWLCGTCRRYLDKNQVTNWCSLCVVCIKFAFVVVTTCMVVTW